ncbi:unnamed protein product [Gongylonema pulchrum]|uniref:Ribonuclease E inhibitor RraB n=1 Tax=Gongylonema pulchrum TaxID=637853 RepID=A0A183EIH3_9BILA|nr:unnamed protein product [Gongylonema pulchrum]
MDLVTLDRRDGSFLGQYLPEDASPQYGDELVDEDRESDDDLRNDSGSPRTPHGHRRRRRRRRRHRRETI